MSLCGTCGCALSRRNSSGYCRRHLSAVIAANPEWREKQKAGLRRKMAHDPEFVDALKERARKIGGDPALHPNRAAVFKAGEYWKLAHAAHPAGSEVRKRAARTLSETRLGWCPPHLREDYRQLIRRHHFRASEARELIEKQHELDMARWRRKVTPEAPVKVVNPVSVAVDPFDRCLEVATQFTGLERAIILSPGRKANIVNVRQAIQFSLAALGWSLSEIGRRFGQDHTTVRHHIRVAEEKLTGEEFGRLVDVLEEALAPLQVAA